MAGRQPDTARCFPAVTSIVHTSRPAESETAAFIVELFARRPYSVHDDPRLASFGIALERQTGVHAIGTDRRRDFDTWMGTMVFTPAGMDVFSESEVGGEYLVIRWEEGGADPSRPMSRPQRTAPPALLRRAFLLRQMLACGAPAQQLEAVVQDLMAEADAIQALAPEGRDLPALRERYAAVLERIEDELGRPGEDLTLATLSASVDQAPLAFLRHFKRLTGMTPHAYVSERRLQRARSELLAAPGSLADIAAASGYASQSHMGVAFQRALQLTPSAYRERIRQSAASGA